MDARRSPSFPLDLSPEIADLRSEFAGQDGGMEGYMEELLQLSVTPRTSEEQQVFWEAHAQLGNKFVEIAKLRTDNKVKNFYNSSNAFAQRSFSP